MSSCTGLDALKSAVIILGSQTAVAAAVGRTPQAVSDVLSRSGNVPAEWCVALEAATAAKDKKIPRGAFRPDIYPDEPVAHPFAPVDLAKAKRGQGARRRECAPRNHQRGLRSLVGG